MSCTLLEHLQQHLYLLFVDMKLLACIALLLCALNAADALRYITIGQRTKAAAASWTRPWFCGDLECPVFKNLTRDEDYEIREYKPCRDHASCIHILALTRG